MIDELRGQTRHRAHSAPHPIVDDTTRRISPAETSQVNEIVAALMAQVGEVIESRICAAMPPSSGDTVSMRRVTRTGYRGVIGALAAGLVAAITWGVAQVEAYGDGRESAARAAIAAEAKAAEAARYAEETRKVAESAALHAETIDRKLDIVIKKLEERR